MPDGQHPVKGHSRGLFTSHLPADNQPIHTLTTIGWLVASKAEMDAIVISHWSLCHHSHDCCDNDQRLLSPGFVEAEPESPNFSSTSLTTSR